MTKHAELNNLDAYYANAHYIFIFNSFKEDCLDNN